MSAPAALGRATTPMRNPAPTQNALIVSIPGAGNDDGLWGLIPGSGAGNGGSASSIYLSARPDDESHGLFGVLAVAVPLPEPATFALLGLSLAGLGFSRRKLLVDPASTTAPRRRAVVAR